MKECPVFARLKPKKRYCVQRVKRKGLFWPGCDLEDLKVRDESEVDSNQFGHFFHKLIFDPCQSLFVFSFKAKYQYRLRVGCSDESPAAVQDDPGPIQFNDVNNALVFF